MKTFSLFSKLIFVTVLCVSCTSGNKSDKILSKRIIKILTIGDSNGAFEGSWVEKLKQAHDGYLIYNTSVSGNTIGFNNNNKTSLNTLLNVDRYLDEADDYLDGLDDIIIMLGTNDCKAVFADSLKMVLKGWNSPG
jgi:lysophospholipase L1-like esterase